MASRRHRIDPDARSDGESWVSRPFEPERQRRWIDSVPPAVGRKGHVCFVIAPRRGVQTLLRRDASHPRPLRPIVRPLVFRQSLDRLNPDCGLAHRLGFGRILVLDLGPIAPPCRTILNTIAAALSPAISGGARRRLFHYLDPGLLQE